MNVSYEKRLQLSLIIFFLSDHLIWYYGGYFSSVTFPYTILSECIRILAFLGFIDCFYSKKYAEKIIFYISIYCFLMIPFSFFAGRSYDRSGKVLLENVFLIKKQQDIPVEYGMIGFFVYMYLLLVLYVYAWKYLNFSPKK